MKHKSYRILFTIIALVLGVGIVLALSFAGKQSKGPIENILTKASIVVSNVEQNLIVEQREEKRSDKLAWLEPYKNNPALLKRPKLILLGGYTECVLLIRLIVS